MSDSNGGCGGLSWGMLAILFIILKLTGAITWPWVYVLLPILIPLGILLVVLLGFLFVLSVGFVVGFVESR